MPTAWSQQIENRGPHLKTKNPKRCLDKSKTYRPNSPRNETQCVNDSQIGTPTCQNSGCNTSKTKREAASRKYQNLDRKPLKTRPVFDPQNRMPQRKTRLFFEDHAQTNAVSERFSEINKAPNPTNACPHRGPQKTKTGIQHLRNQNQKRCLDKSKT